jgi:hypothetical protein
VQPAAERHPQQRPTHHSTIVAVRPKAHHSAAAAVATFKRDYEKAAIPLRRSAEAIGAALRGSPSESRTQLLAEFQALSAQWGSEVGQLDALTPPPRLGPVFNNLTAAGDRVHSDLTAIVGALTTHNSTAGGQALGHLVNDLFAARSADTTIETALGAA